ncbi:50S ribosomal protein L15 [Desulfoluna sp.]|uniref:50S ribosomal protein L15 n=1 Tax=Desulfoluna sp. TaxID=2045199 RepID=UPI002630A394|nr:50S ribosomal protein L15 [Desulfoluna sp.]
MKLNELSPAEGSVKARKRIGRGVGSGWGKTSGRGTKGFKSRSGGNVRPGFEGGQMPIHRRLPKRGFTNIFKKEFAILNIKDLVRFEDGQVVDEAALVAVGLVKGNRDGIKILGNGDLTMKLTIKECLVSKSAREKIEAAGGTVEA